MAKSNYITRQGWNELDQELKFLWKEERPKVTQAVSDAAALGDRSENAEYIYGKRRLREIDRRVRFLTKRLEVLQIVDYNPKQEGKVFFGAWVELENEDGEIAANLRGGMNINACLGMGKFCHDARNEWHIQNLQFMGYAVDSECFYGWITTDDFAPVLRGGVAKIGGLNISGQHIAHLGEAQHNALSNIARVFVEVAIATIMVRAVWTETKTCFNLFDKQIIESLHIHANAIFHRIAIDGWTTIITRKKHTSAEVYDFLKSGSTGKRIAMPMLMKETFHLTHICKTRYSLLKLFSKIIQSRFDRS